MFVTWKRAKPTRRSKDYPLGFPDLNEQEIAVATHANAVTSSCFDLFKKAAECGVACTLENPNSSTMWHIPECLHLKGSFVCNECIFDHCRFGVDFKKRTRLLTVNLDDLDELNKVCNHSRAHQLLSGWRVPNRTMTPTRGTGA